MANLTQMSPAAGLLPITQGDTTLTEIPFREVWSIQPYAGVDAFPDLGFPGPGDVRGAMVWAGHGQVFCFGAPPRDLSAKAAVIPQSDAWVQMQIEGPHAAEVLARLVPVDVTQGAAAVKTILGHMPALILRTSDTGDQFEILTFRSMAKTAVHELDRAMRMVAARDAVSV